MPVISRIRLMTTCIQLRILSSLVTTLVPDSSVEVRILLVGTRFGFQNTKSTVQLIPKEWSEEFLQMNLSPKLPL